MSRLQNLLCRSYSLPQLWQAGQGGEELKGCAEHPWPEIRKTYAAPSAPVTPNTADMVLYESLEAF